MILHIFKNLNQIYATYSMMTGLLSTIAVGILLLLIVSVIVITIVIWFPDEQNDDHKSLDEVRNPKLVFWACLYVHIDPGPAAEP